MLYETLLQGLMFLCMFYFGLLAGILYEVKLFIGKPFQKLLPIKIVLDTIFCVISTFIFLGALNSTAFGEFRPYLLISFILGIIIEHTTIGFLVEKFLKWLYNLLCKLMVKCKRTKLFKKILK